MLRRPLLLVIVTLSLLSASAQVKPLSGVLTANVMDEKKKALEGASSEIISLADTLQKQTALTDKEGNVSFQNIPYGYYRLRVSYVGLQTLTIDSIYFRAERSDFNLSDLTLKAKNSENLSEI